MRLGVQFGNIFGNAVPGFDRLLYLALVSVNDTEIVLSCCVGLRVLVGRNCAQHVDSFIESTSFVVLLAQVKTLLHGHLL